MKTKNNKLILFIIISTLLLMISGSLILVNSSIAPTFAGNMYLSAEVAEGKGTFSVYYHDGDYSENNTLTATEDSGAQVDKDVDPGASADTVYVTCTATPATGYHLNYIYVEGKTDSTTTNPYEFSDYIKHWFDTTTKHRVCKAYFAINNYQVSFNGNGNTSGSMSNQSFTYDQAQNLTANGYSKIGYSFAGWSTSANGSVEYSNSQSVSNLTSTNNGTVTLYAVWTANTYTVTLDKQSGSGGSSSVTATYDSAMPEITPPERTGYSFKGYYTGTNGSGTKYYDNNGKSVQNWDKTSNTTLYANWEANGYTLTMDANGGSITSSDVWTGSGTKVTKTVKYNDTYDTYVNDKGEVKVGYLPTSSNISRTGYTFAGWWTASSGGSQVSSSTKMDSTSGKTIYAHWTANSYKITFNQNSGSGGSSSTTVTYDKAMPSITIPKRIGYSFEGYYDSPQTDYGDTGGGTQYYKSDGTSARNWDKATDTTLYARWLPRDDYKVDINILSPTGEQDYKSGTMTQAYGSTIKEGINDQGFDNITYKESWTISKITPTPGYVLTSVSANAGTLVDNGDGTYTFTANFTSDPNGSWDAVITIQMGDTWTNYAEEPTVKRKIEVNGTTVEAREISKPEHLAWISKMLLTTSNGGYYIQTKPIDMSDHYWYPIGANGRAFTGYYNGQGYAIMNVETSPNMVTESGLFGYIQGGTVENVTMLNAKIQGGIDSGGIAGVNNGGVIRNCYVEGEIKATNRGVSSTQYSIGGLVGYSTSGQIESSYYEGTISGTGNRYYGLLIGYGENSSIRDSIGKTTGNTAYYNNGVSVESSLYITGANYVTKKYYEGTFANWAITNGQPLPSGLTWIGNAGDKVTNISQITACGYSKV